MTEKKSKDSDKNKNKPKYEDQVQQLEGIIRKLEEGNLELEQSISLYEDGMKLLRACEKQLHQAEKKIEKLVKDETSIKKIPFNPEKTEP